MWEYFILGVIAMTFAAPLIYMLCILIATAVETNTGTWCSNCDKALGVMHKTWRIADWARWHSHRFRYFNRKTREWTCTP